VASAPDAQGSGPGPGKRHRRESQPPPPLGGMARAIYAARDQDGAEEVLNWGNCPFPMPAGAVAFRYGARSSF